VTDCDRLFASVEAFDFSPAQEKLFLAALKENFTHHYNNSRAYKNLCDLRGFTPGDLTGSELIPQVPHLFVSVLKKRKLLSVPEKEIVQVVTSSGTGGRKSANYLDEITLTRVKQVIWNIYQSFKMADRKETANYLCFTYDPEHAKELGTAFSDQLLTGLTKVKQSFFALQFDPGQNDFYLDKEGVLNALKEFSRSSLPLRILGFPSFLYQVLGEIYQKQGKPFNFGKRSFIITGGGWKTLADREIPKAEFREKIAFWLGIPKENVRDLYGLVEHGIPYCECEAGHFHVPVYSRVFARDPGTLRLLPTGEFGILQLVTPYLNSVPALSLLTTDWGRVLYDCPCGRKAPVLDLRGRAGVVKPPTCALAALEFLK